MVVYINRQAVKTANGKGEDCLWLTIMKMDLGGFGKSRSNPPIYFVVGIERRANSKFYLCRRSEKKGGYHPENRGAAVMVT